MSEHIMRGFKSGLPNYGGIIMPFESRWYADVLSGRVKAVFRKKGPSPKASPRWLYAYFGVPVSAIAAKMEITKIHRLTVGQALRYLKDGMLNEKELLDYSGEAEHLTVIQVGEVVVPHDPVGMAVLSKRLGFKPTPSFVALSDYGIEQLDSILGTAVGN